MTTKRRKKIMVVKKHLPNFTGDAWLVKKGTRYYVVSGTTAMFSDREVLVFGSDKNGKVKHWREVCGGRGISHEEAIKELEDLT